MNKNNTIFIPPKFFVNSEEKTGFSTPNSHPVPLTRKVADRPMSLAWITDELLRYTQEIWSKAYGRNISEDEAIEMLLNVKRLAEVIQKSCQNERR